MTDYKVQERADGCLDYTEVQEAKANDLGPAEYVEVKYGVSPSDYASEKQLAKAMRQSRRGEAVTAAKAPTGQAADYDEALEQRCDDCMASSEVASAKERGMSPSQFIKHKYSIDGSQYGSSLALEEAIRDKRQRGDFIRVGDR